MVFPQSLVSLVSFSHFASSQILHEILLDAGTWDRQKEEKGRRRNLKFAGDLVEFWQFGNPRRGLRHDLFNCEVW